MIPWSDRCYNTYLEKWILLVANAIFMRNVLISQGYDERPAMLMQDNEAAIKLAENGFFSAMRTRHINIRYFFVKDRIAKGEIEVKYCSTKLRIADCLTKPVQGRFIHINIVDSRLSRLATIYVVTC